MIIIFYSKNSSQHLSILKHTNYGMSIYQHRPYFLLELFIQYGLRHHKITGYDLNGSSIFWHNGMLEYSTFISQYMYPFLIIISNYHST